MFRDFDEFGRRHAPTQTVDIPRRQGRVRQPRDLREAYWLLQQDLQQAQADAAAWKAQAQKLETAVHQARRSQPERVIAQAQQEVAAAKSRIAELEAALAKQTAVRPDEQVWQEKVVRLQADFENSKKRLQQRYAREAEQEKEKILRDMLPLADHLERALAHVKNREDEAGIMLTLKAFTAVLQQYGVRAIDVSGEPFNPEIHEAIGVVNQPDQKAGTILAVVEKGYMLNNKLLRPAKVLVVAEQ